MECWRVEYIGPIATLIAALVGGAWLMFIHWLNMKRAARAEFRASILNILEGVYPIRTIWGEDIAIKLRDGQPKLQRAISIFRHYLPRRKVSSFDKAWDDYSKYYYSVTDSSISAHNLYSGICNKQNEIKEKDPYKEFCLLVDRLLAYAK